MKTALKIIGGLVALFLIAIVAIPFFVNVDQYRPQIIEAANQQLNGELSLGKLSLSLWGGVHVKVDGLKVVDLAKKEVVSVSDASFDMPYLSVLGGLPLVTVALKQPTITVIKEKDGKLNIMSLAKLGKEATPTSGTQAAPQAAQASSGGKVALPAIAVNAHFGLSIENAKLNYKDETLALANTIDHLNLRVKDFSLARKTELELWADLKTQMGSDLKIEGPLKLTADLSPEISNGEFKSATVNANFSADDLTIEKDSLFTKKKGVAMNFKFSGTLDQASLKLKEASTRFHNAEIVVNGTYSKLAGADIHFEAKPIELKSWSELVPMLKEYELEGKFGLKGDVKGKPEAIAYNAKLTIDGFSAKGPNLKAKPVINGSIEVATDKVERFLIDLKGPGNEITLDGKVISFSKPQITFAVSSPKGMDLDQWIEFPKPAAPDSKNASAKSGSAGTATSSAGKAEDMDAMLDPIRKNEMLKGLSVDGSVAIAFIKAKGIRIDDIGLKLQFKNLVAAMSNIKMRLYDGTLTGSFSTDLKPQAPAYTMNVVLAGLDLQKAAASQFPSFKDTLDGKLSASIQGGGSSFNPDSAKKRLQMKGNFKLANAAFKSIDIAKTASEAINGSIAKIGDKVPLLKGKNLHVNSSGDSRYEMISSDFTINNGFLDAPNFVAKATPKHGIDLKGSTKMGLIDESLDAKWELTDTYHLTGADQLTVNVAGKDIHNFLAKSENDPVILPITVGCKWSAPCVGYSQVSEYLAGVAAGRLSHVAQDVVKQKAQDAGKNLIKNGLKGLFGH